MLSAYAEHFTVSGPDQLKRESFITTGVAGNVELIHALDCQVDFGSAETCGVGTLKDETFTLADGVGSSPADGPTTVIPPVGSPIGPPALPTIAPGQPDPSARVAPPLGWVPEGGPRVNPFADPEYGGPSCAYYGGCTSGTLDEERARREDRVEGVTEGSLTRQDDTANLSVLDFFLHSQVL